MVIASVLTSYRQLHVAKYKHGLSCVILMMDGDKGFDKSNIIISKMALKRLHANDLFVYATPDTSKQSAIDQLKHLLSMYDGKIALKIEQFDTMMQVSYVDEKYKNIKSPIPSFSHNFTGYFYIFLMTSNLCEVVIDSNASLDERSIFRALSFLKGLSEYKYYIMKTHHFSKLTLYTEKKVGFKITYGTGWLSELQVNNLPGFHRLNGNTISIHMPNQNWFPELKACYKSFISIKIKNPDHLVRYNSNIIIYDELYFNSTDDEVDVMKRTSKILLKLFS